MEQRQNSKKYKVHQYSYSPDQYLKYGEGPLWHGIELEVGWGHSSYSSERDSYARQVIDALGEYAYLKEDGSISSADVRDGFEIVTHPASLQECSERLRGICDGNIPGLLSHDGGTGLGLHISVNRDGLTNHAIARICAFVGAERNHDWLCKLARRESDQWAKIVKKDKIEDTIETYTDYLGVQRERIKANESRYEAVNLQNTSHLEFRLFRGTLKYTSLMTCIEFVNALCTWCLIKVPVYDYQSANAFFHYVDDRTDTYPHFVKFLRANI